MMMRHPAWPIGNASIQREWFAKGIYLTVAQPQDPATSAVSIASTSPILLLSDKGQTFRSPASCRVERGTVLSSHVVLSHIFANQPSLPLTQMITAQKARQSEKLQRPFGSNFLSFLTASKPEIDNIFFSFHSCACYWPIKFMPCVQGYENYKRMRARRKKKLSGCVVA